MTINELAIQVDSDVGNISRLERDVQGFSPQLLSRIADALSVPVAELFSNDDPHQNTELVPIPASTIRMVPLISWVQAGSFCATDTPELPADDYESYACPNPKAGPRTFALKVRGDSMTNAIGGGRSYPEGTIIFVDPDHPASVGQRVVACLEDGGCTFKELAENEMGRQYLRAINPRYTISDHDHPAKICGVVIGSYLPE